MTGHRNAKRAFFSLLCALLLLGGMRRPAQAGEVKVDKDVVFGTVQGVKLLLDVYQPDGFAGKRPGIVLVHGGGFMFGDKSFYAPMAHHLAEKGYVAYSVNYRFAPQFHYPAQIDDVQRAIRWIRAHADTYQLDPERLGALGDSAGGYLVAMLGIRDTRDNSDMDLAKYSSRVQCVVDLYGPTDFTIPAAKAAVSSQAIYLLTQYFGKPQEEAMDLYKEGSPIIYVDAKSAPFLILHGTTDPLVPCDQSQRLYDALKTSGVEATLLLLYKQAHGFLKPADPQQAGVLADDFFAKHLKP